MVRATSEQLLRAAQEEVTRESVIRIREMGLVVTEADVDRLGAIFTEVLGGVTTSETPASSSVPAGEPTAPTPKPKPKAKPKARVSASDAASQAASLDARFPPVTEHDAMLYQNANSAKIYAITSPTDARGVWVGNGLSLLAEWPMVQGQRFHSLATAFGAFPSGETTRLRLN
jgi:hypothetical protein